MIPDKINNHKSPKENTVEVLKNEITQGLSTICLYVDSTEFNRFFKNAYVENARIYEVYYGK